MKLLFLTIDEMPDLLPYDMVVFGKLRSQNIQTDIMVWEDLGKTSVAHLQQYQGIVIRTCWNYYKKPDEFIQLLDFCEQNSLPLLNPSDIVRWNMDKRYLLDLQKEGIEIIPTEFVFEHHGGLFTKVVNKGWKKVVVKPMISGGSYHTFVVDAKEEAEFNTIINTYYQNRPYLLQEFIPEISTGEISTLRFANGFTYSIAKVPKEGDYRVQFTYGGKYNVEEVQPKIAAINNFIETRFQNRLLYQRVDGVWRDNRFLLMEVELVEPDLYLGHHAEALENWVKNLTAIAGR